MERDEAIALTEGNLWTMWSQFGRGPQCALIDEPELLRFETPITQAPYNAVLRSRLDQGVDEHIDAVLNAYAARNVPVVWIVHPSARPADLDRRLEARGLVEAEVCPGMIADLEEVPTPDARPDGIEITEVGPDAHDPFIELVAFRYNLQDDAVPVLRGVMQAVRFAHPDAPTRGWIARRDGVVISKVVLHLGAGVAGIYGVATRPEARGLGLARSLILRALDEARRLGLRTAVLHSTPMAVTLYKGIGFRTVADFRLYALPDTLRL
ncbi:MAG TPA: GNAT family N-acetyltransferase [Acidimicrobiia bacterium]|nr:GNAT family N-acetyltransferase [Acidimicrobiia bacterium]